MKSTPTEAPGKGSAKILVVDDDERNLLALSEVLGSIAKVVTAASGHDALRLLMKQDFAVILLDVFMPGIDGYETAALIRDREQTSRIPIIFLSAVNKETEHLVKGYEMGAVDYVFKPVDPMILKSKVSVFVDLYNMRRQIEVQAAAESKLREANYREQLSRIEVERQLQQAERRQATILRALPMAIYEADGEDAVGVRRTFVGGDLEYFLGDAASEVLGGTLAWDEWIHPDDRKQGHGCQRKRRRPDRHRISLDRAERHRSPFARSTGRNRRSRWHSPLGRHFARRVGAQAARGATGPCRQARRARAD